MITLNVVYSEGNDRSRLLQHHCNIFLTWRKKNCLWDISHFHSAQCLHFQNDYAQSWVIRGTLGLQDHFIYVLKCAAVWCTLLWIYRQYIWMKTTNHLKIIECLFLKHSTFVVHWPLSAVKISSIIQRGATLVLFTFHKWTNHSEAGGSSRWVQSLLVTALSASLKVSFQSVKWTHILR